MRSRWITPLLIVLAAVGLFLVFTSDDGDAPPALDAITTAEGLDTQIPAGWVQRGDFEFEFAPAGDEQVFDQWTVARGCPLDGCAALSLEEWLDMAESLPTFVSVRAAEADSIFNVALRWFDDALVMTGQTTAAGDLVFAAHFGEGATSYVACSARLSLPSDERLVESLIEVCRATAPLD
ncbi:MAG: hypothetical protein ACI9MX_002420 [Candidatus Aldehydirespiratoraceae bacterium]|jgi:hypothetical protein